MLFPIELYTKMWRVTIWETSATKKALNRTSINNHRPILNPPNRFLNLNLPLYLIRSLNLNRNNTKNIQGNRMTTVYPS